MKILYIAPASVNHTVRWVNAMVDRGHDVHLLSLYNHRESINKIDRRVSVHYLPVKGMKGYYLNYFKAKRIVKDINPDVVNTHYASGYGTLSRLINHPNTLLSVWGSDVFDFPYESKIKNKILIKNLKAAKALASTSYVMKEQTQKFNKYNKHIFVTPFGVDVNLFKSIENSKDENLLTIGIVKTLKEKYGVKYLIEAVAKLKAKLQEEKHEYTDKLRLNIVGDGELKNDLEELTRKLGIDDITNFKGYIKNTEIPKELNKLDIYCAPSILDSESFGVAVIEASACGIPVVVSNVGGLSEVVDDGITGYIVEKKNSEDISNKLYELIMDKQLRKNMGINGMTKVAKEYKWDENVKYMESIYLNL